MNEAENKVKLEIVEKIRTSTNILVTVSKDPSVDELSAALGLTALLNKLDKHATAIFSGDIPPAITFLEPDKVFENSTDSLRDFIIALDKEKADHLRYKVVGDVVKIFITPYRTTITADDLQFSQGDYNVELVLALGVENQEHLDLALAEHGLMLGEVEIATFCAGEQSSQLGSMSWRDEGASSLSEMVTSISDKLKLDKPLLDKQISTALLTGIVAATERFSNSHTTPYVMTIASQLMAAGADQQLISSKLQDTHEITSLPSIAVDKVVPVATPASSSDELTIDHADTPIEDDTDEEPAKSPAVKAPTIQEIIAAKTADDGPVQEEEPEPEPEPVESPEPAPSAVSASIAGVTDFSNTLVEPSKVTLPVSELSSESAADESAPIISGVKSGGSDEAILGKKLDETSDQSAEDARRQLDEQQDKTILSHSYLDNSDQAEVAPINSIGQTEDVQSVDIFADGPMSTLPPEGDAVVAPPPPPPVPTSGLPLPPPLPDFSTLPATAETPPPSAMPGLSSPFSSAPVSDAVSTLPPDNTDPSQFHIPA